MKGKILVIDDEKDIRFSLQGIFSDEGYEVVEAQNGEDGIEVAKKMQPDVVFLDIWLPGIDGLEVLERLRQIFPDLPIIMISGHGNIETAVQAMRKGAFDFIEKPFSLDSSLVILKKAFDFVRLRKENKDLRLQVQKQHVQKLSGISKPITELKELIAQVAPTSAWVLISGENGTGKEIVARSIHLASTRKDKPMVAVNCAAIPEELIESELFGHAKGAFTGAEKMKQGKFEIADKGTLFLDEIGDMSLKTQAKILRILQEQQFERVGENTKIKVDVRVIAASNKDLEEEIAKGNFRQDLYYRLNVFPLRVPPLRQRREDIGVLLKEFVEFMVQQHGFRSITFTKEAFVRMENYSWPGNVREMKNFVERLFILYQGREIEAGMLPLENAVPVEAGESFAASQVPADFKEARAMFDRWFLQREFDRAGRNISKLAKNIGMERSYVHRMLKNFDISKNGG